MHFSKIFLPFLITVAIAQNVDNDNDDDDGDDGNDAPNSVSSFVHGVVASRTSLAAGIASTAIASHDDHCDHDNDGEPDSDCINGNSNDSSNDDDNDDDNDSDDDCDDHNDGEDRDCSNSTSRAAAVNSISATLASQPTPVTRDSAASGTGNSNSNSNSNSNRNSAGASNPTTALPAATGAATTTPNSAHGLAAGSVLSGAVIALLVPAAAGALI